MLEKSDSLSLAIYVFLVLAVILVMLSSYFLGERHKEKATDEVYESGIKSNANFARGVSVTFYLFALFFLIFDLETVFLLSYSVVAKDLGVPGLMHLTVFVLFLLLALFYLARRGAFFIEGVKKGIRSNEHEQ